MEIIANKPKSSLSPARVLIFPLPLQGHVNSMLKLAELLALAGLHVTFLNSDYNHHRLLRYSNIHTRLLEYPGFRFETISDGLPADFPRSGFDAIMELLFSVRDKTSLLFRELLLSCRGNDKSSVDFIIADGFMGFAIDIANELGIPIIHFRTISACCFWVYYCIPQMIKIGELPIKGEEDMDRVIKSVPTMETFLRCRDLPTLCRSKNLLDPALLAFMSETQQSPRAYGLILNTFDDLEGPILSQIRTRCPNLYTVGPLHSHLRVKLCDKQTSSTGLFQEDRSCIEWLNSQATKSVIYVSLGSITILTRDELMEFWYGLVNSKHRFLWVLRPDTLAGKAGKLETPVELEAGTKERGYIVEWAPQEEVLAHKAIGGFLTHSGWNSTLESVVAGIPMICWPYIVDQQVNSRFVSELWKLGLDMKDVCDRGIVEQMVNDLMVEKRDELLKSSESMAELARKSVVDGGSSTCNIERLIQDIKSMVTIASD